MERYVKNKQSNNHNQGTISKKYQVYKILDKEADIEGIWFIFYFLSFVSHSTQIPTINSFIPIYSSQNDSHSVLKMLLQKFKIPKLLDQIQLRSISGGILISENKVNLS